MAVGLNKKKLTGRKPPSRPELNSTRGYGQSGDLSGFPNFFRLGFAQGLAPSMVRVLHGGCKALCKDLAPSTEERNFCWFFWQWPCGAGPGVKLSDGARSHHRRRAALCETLLHL